MPANGLPLSEAHLWCVRPDCVIDPELLGRYERLLAEDERRQRDRFYFPEGRRDYLLARALVRTTLSRYADVPPEGWRFRTNLHGRPEVAEPASHRALRFNVSHTKGFLACVVALDRDVGVDVENTARPGRLMEIAERYFSPVEATSLRSLPEHAQRDRFFEYWTLKESFIKALGVGIGFGLSRFSFLLDEEPIRIAFDAQCPEDPARWQFALLRPSPDHVLATSLHRELGEDLRVVVRQVFPVAGDGAGP